MTDFDLEYIGLGILAAFFGIYDEKVMEEMKLLVGKYVIENGGVENVLEKELKNIPIGTPKERIIKELNECIELARAKGIINVKE